MSGEWVIWEDWFAWHPIKTIDGKWLWLRIVWRRKEDSIFYYKELRL